MLYTIDNVKHKQKFTDLLRKRIHPINIQNSVQTVAYQMSKTAGYIVLLSSSRQAILETRLGDERFAEPVPEFKHSRNVPLVCFVVGTEKILSHICLGSRGHLAGTDLRRLNMRRLFKLTSAVSINTILSRTPRRFHEKLMEKLTNGGILPPKTFESLISILSELAPETTEVLRKYREERRERIGRLSNLIQSSLAEQKEAVTTAIAIAGIEKEELSGWDFDESAGPTSFLDGLPSLRLREDQMLSNDLAILPGYKCIKNTMHSATVFQNSHSRLTVILANRLPLEEQTGTDLIYYNETFKCFLMVQYKAMEGVDGEAVYRFPNEQLTEEIQRMDLLLQELKKCNGNTEADGYRLSENPFFLKVCPRLVFDPDNVGLSKGMYLPLDYWKFLSKHPGLIGPKGGKRLSYRNVRRYFDNTEFVTIASGGWVGTNIDQSSMLEAVIRATLESGRAVVVAMNKEMDDRHRIQD